MKKVLVIAMLVVMVVSTLAGCGAADTKTGVGSVISIAKSKSATADAAGAGQADVVMAAVTVDKDGKILKVSIDTAQVKIPFDATGTVTADLTAELKTKKELGDAYGMKKNSEIEKEWYEQIASLEAWMIGKTAAQVKAMKVSEDGNTTETDLVSSVTISVGDYIEAVDEAITNAK
ncbi:MAG: hypothetical protein ACYCYM_02340 [Saccharofermentanales bacterium]